MAGVEIVEEAKALVDADLEVVVDLDPDNVDLEVVVGMALVVLEMAVVVMLDLESMVED